MSVSRFYPRDIQSPSAEMPQSFSAAFDWDFSSERGELLALYEKGKARQWNPTDRIDWDQELDPENPQLLPPEALPIHDAPLFKRLSRREQIEVMRHYQAWQNSQFLHGEQGGVVCAAKIVQLVPDADAKLYAATQVVDEARHVEMYRKLTEKFGLAYPLTGPLHALLGQVMRDSRWDVTYLGMQVVIEGLALACFARIRDQAQNPLAAAINAYVMEDEARHVAFGALSLNDFYPKLTQAERNEREDFLIEALALMRDRLHAAELWRHLDLPADECLRHVANAPSQVKVINGLFGRIVPTMRAIGLFSPKVRRACAAMGILHLAAADIADMQADDERIAHEFDVRRAYVRAVAAAGAG